jgi:hypothetical protein
VTILITRDIIDILADQISIIEKKTRIKQENPSKNQNIFFVFVVY